MWWWKCFRHLWLTRWLDTWIEEWIGGDGVILEGSNTISRYKEKNSNFVVAQWGIEL
jgi:hypothetical protein